MRTANGKHIRISQGRQMPTQNQKSHLLRLDGKSYANHYFCTRYLCVAWASVVLVRCRNMHLRIETRTRCKNSTQRRCHTRASEYVVARTENSRLTSCKEIKAKCHTLTLQLFAEMKWKQTKRVLTLTLMCGTRTQTPPIGSMMLIQPYVISSDFSMNLFGRFSSYAIVAMAAAALRSTSRSIHRCFSFYRSMLRYSVFLSMYGIWNTCYFSYIYLARIIHQHHLRLTPDRDIPSLNRIPSLHCIICMCAWARTHPMLISHVTEHAFA